MANDAAAFLVLGPLEVRAGERSISLGGPRQRAVLADLVLHAGSVVSRDTLIDDLWAGRAPPTAEAVVQNAVSRLRHALGKEAIETRAGGYSLRAEPGVVDARRFERLVHDARPLPPAERSAALRDALALWRGSPFADLSYESFLQGEIARLDELRLTALEDRVEAEIELGGHDDVIPDAARLAAQHPDRERLCRLLMLAYFRAGRQQEALDAYEATRHALVEQWGLEPSPETRALHRMILSQDPALAPAQPVVAAIGTVRRPVSLLLVEPLLDDGLELEAAGAVVRDVRRTVADVVSRHGGALPPESGVELIAAFGADGAHEDDVVRAARAGVEIRELLRGRDVQARLAIGTGRLLVDGSTPVLVGAAVGRTRRALRDAAADEIQLTAIAARLGGDAFELDADSRLLGVSAVRPRPREDLAPLVGRAEELARLRAAFERVVDTEKPGHVVVVGEAGIGKSRLVTVFADDIRAVVLDAACTPYGEGITFLPLRELADRAAALDESAPALGDLESADAAFAAAGTLLGHFAVQGPLVVVLDDLHWAVPTFLDLVEYVVRAVDGPMLVVSVTRPELLERRPAWGEGATTLEPIGGDDARLLVDALPEREVLDDALATAILDAAEGVPLFVEQLAAHAAEADLVDEGIPTSLDALLASRIDVLEPGERAVLSRAAVVGRAFSRESLGALTPDAEARELDGRLASLERRRLVRPRGDDHEFVHPLVRGAAYEAIGRPERAAMHETFARWLDECGEGDELVGTHLERAVLDIRGVGQDARQLADDAAELLGRAGERAVWRRDNHGAVSLLLRAAALLPELEARRLELECLASVPLKNLWQSLRAVALLDDVVTRSGRLGDRRLELRARVEQVWPSLNGGQIDVESAVAILKDAVEVCGAEDDLLGVARGWHMLVVVESRLRHQFDAAVHAGLQAEAFYERYGTPGIADSLTAGLLYESTMTVADAVVFCESRLEQAKLPASRAGAIALGLSALKALTGEFDHARELIQRSRSQFLDIGDEVAVATDVSHAWASLEILAVDADSARAIAQAGLDAARASDDRVWQTQFLSQLADIALLDGQHREALDLTDDARKGAIESDLHQALGWRIPRAHALAVLGQADEAEWLAREGLQLVDPTDYLLGRGLIRDALAHVLGESGRYGEAVSIAEQAVALFDEKGASLLADRARQQVAAFRRGEPAKRAPLERP